jgi:hypothetical protein
VRESGSSEGYLRVFSYRGVFCKSVEVQGGFLKFPLNLLYNSLLFWWSTLVVKCTTCMLTRGAVYILYINIIYF